MYSKFIKGNSNYEHYCSQIDIEVKRHVQSFEIILMGENKTIGRPRTSFFFLNVLIYKENKGDNVISFKYMNE